MLQNVRVLFQPNAEAHVVLESLGIDEFKSISPEMLATKTHVATVIIDDGGIAGIAALNVYPDEARIHVEFLEVSSSNRGNGHARRLYERIFQEAAKIGTELGEVACVTGNSFTEDGKRYLMGLKDRVKTEKFPQVESFQIPGGA